MNINVNSKLIKLLNKLSFLKSLNLNINNLNSILLSVKTNNVLNNCNNNCVKMCRISTEWKVWSKMKTNLNVIKLYPFTIQCNEEYLQNILNVNTYEHQSDMSYMLCSA